MEQHKGKSLNVIIEEVNIERYCLAYFKEENCVVRIQPAYI